MADNEFTLPMDYEPTEDISVNAVQATEDPGKFLQEGSGPAIVETSLDKVSDAGTASQDWLVESFAQAATGTFNTPDLWKNRKPTTVEEIGRSLVHGFAGSVKSTLSGVVKTAAYAEAAMEDAEHGLAELIVGRSFPNRNFGRALIHSMNEKERSEAWERTLYENRQGIKSDAWYNMLSSAFGSSATLFGAAVAGVPAKTLAGAEGLMIGASYFSEQSSKLESTGESGAKALPFSAFIGTLGGLIAKTGGEAIISDAVQSKFGPAAVSFARGATDNLVKRISKRLLNPVAKKAAKAEAIEELAQEASTIGTEKIQDAVLGTQVNQSTWQEDTQRMFVGLAGGATVGGLVGEYVYNKNLNKLQKKLEPVFEGDKNKSFEAATAIADAVLNEVAAENAAVKSLEGHVADLNPELAQVLSHVFEDLVNQGFVDFRQATPDEVRQAGLDWANLMSAAAILDAMERNIPLRTHPLFKAIAEIDRILLEGRDPSTGDLLPLDINNAQVRELANQIEDYIEQNRETRQAEEASKLAALREADMRARQETIQELERAAIAELEKEQAANNQERITELQQQITELQHQMDLLREERSQYVKERAAQGRISIGRAKAQTAPDNKALTKKAIRSGNLDIIKQILQDNGFKTRDLSGTQIKQMAQLNWEMFAGKDLGATKSKFDKNVAMKAIQQNVVSGDAVLLRAGYTQGQIDQMDDKTWNRALQAAYREETEALESVQPQLTPEQAAQIPDDLQYQDTPFDLAAENARLDDIYPEYKGDTIEVNGVERTVYNSNGERIAKSEPALRNFWKWFGDSKIVDDQGRPLVVYHYTKNEFSTFDLSRQDKSYTDYETPIGIFATTFNTQKSENFGNIKMPLYMKIENPVIAETRTQMVGFGIKNDEYYDLISQSKAIEQKYVSLWDTAEADKTPDSTFDEIYKKYEQERTPVEHKAREILTQEIKNAGYDGVILKNDSGGLGTKIPAYIVLNPNQIKSVDNRGTFSPDTGNIYYQNQFAAQEMARLDDMYPAYTGETINIDGKERTVYNSNGDRIAKSEPALRNFWNWFGDSKVVDDQGRPLVVYHGTFADVKEFKKKKIRRGNIFGKGFYFTNSKQGAELYSSGKTLSVYLSFQKPFVVWEQEFDFADGEAVVNAITEYGYTVSDTNREEILESESPLYTAKINYGESTLNAISNILARENGYDSLIGMTSIREFVAFEPNQIKSTDNTGEFGIGVNNMYHQDQVVENPVLLDLEDITSDMNVDSVLDLVLSGQDMWDNLIDPVKYKNALQEFVKNGQLLRTKTEDVEQWFETIVRNTALLDTITDIVGHSYSFPETEIKEYFFGTNRTEADKKFQEYKKQLQERDEELPPEFATAEVESTADEEISDGAVLWKLLEDKGFFDNARLPDGSPAWSDYGLRPLWEIIGEYREGMSAEQVLVLINKALDVYHQNGDLASAFIKGGAETAEKISNDYPLDNMMQYQPGYVSLEQIKQGTVFQNKKTSKSTTGLGTEHRGGYDPMTKAIIFNKTSDLTTLFHESAHYWFDRNLRYYRTGLASPEWKKKWEDVMNELGATPNARGTIPVSAIRSASEKFARSMEAYLREGKYESAAIQWAHQDYANMVKRVYRNIWSTYWGLDDLSPAVKQWFDMFGLKTDDATTAFAEEDKIETDEQMVGAVVAEDATKPDVDAETKAIVADAGAQVVENPATQEIAVVPADPFETGKKARSKLPRSAEAATGVSMDDIIYNRRSMSDAFKAAQQLVNTDPVRAWEILKGGQEMVDGLYAGDIYRALIAKYQAENNPTMLKNVVQAFAGAARRAGRSVKAFDLESPRISFEKTINSLDKIFDTKKNDKRIEKVKNELKEFLHDPSALRVGWEEFKNIVGCK